MAVIMLLFVGLPMLRSFFCIINLLLLFLNPGYAYTVGRFLPTPYVFLNVPGRSPIPTLFGEFNNFFSFYAFRESGVSRLLISSMIFSIQM